MSDAALVSAAQAATGLNDAALGRVFGVTGAAVRHWKARGPSTTAVPLLEVLALDPLAWGQAIAARVAEARAAGKRGRPRR